MDPSSMSMSGFTPTVSLLITLLTTRLLLKQLQAALVEAAQTITLTQEVEAARKIAPTQVEAAQAKALTQVEAARTIAPILAEAL